MFYYFSYLRARADRSWWPFPLPIVRKYGKKVAHADEWNIPILNHLWLEECFVQWMDVPTCREAFCTFPPGVSFLNFLSERSLEHGTVETWATREDVQEERREALGLLAASSQAPDSKAVDELAIDVYDEPPPSTSTSTPARVQAALVPKAAKKQATPLSPSTSRPRLETPHRPAAAHVSPETAITSSRKRGGGMETSNILIGSTKRRAAAAATDKLHNEIGPDMMLWEKEKKRSAKKRDRYDVVIDVEDSDEEEDGRAAKVSKVRESPAEEVDRRKKKEERRVI
jgi:hypothetical protein